MYYILLYIRNATTNHIVNYALYDLKNKKLRRRAYTSPYTLGLFYFFISPPLPVQYLHPLLTERPEGVQLSQALKPRFPIHRANKPVIKVMESAKTSRLAGDTCHHGVLSSCRLIEISPGSTQLYEAARRRLTMRALHGVAVTKDQGWPPVLARANKIQEWIWILRH